MSDDVTHRLDQGIDAFNDEAFFEAHDMLEDLWMDIRGSERSFFQGLIQLVIGFYHLSMDNPVGATHLLERALDKLEAYAPAHRDVQLAPLMKTVRQTLARIDKEPDQGAWTYPKIGRGDAVE